MHRHTIKTKIRTKALKSFRIHQDDNAVNVSEFLFYKSSETKNAEGRSMHHHAWIIYALVFSERFALHLTQFYFCVMWISISLSDFWSCPMTDFQICTEKISQSGVLGLLCLRPTFLYSRSICFLFAFHPLYICIPSILYLYFICYFLVNRKKVIIIKYTIKAMGKA